MHIPDFVKGLIAGCLACSMFVAFGLQCRMGSVALLQNRQEPSHTGNLVIDPPASRSVDSKLLQSGTEPLPTAHELPNFLVDVPANRTVDVNIGTNFSPMRASNDNFLLLVDPLLSVCQSLMTQVQSNPNVAVLCCAISNWTGTATFKQYNKQGVSSSLATVAAGTSHASFLGKEIKSTVIVLEAAMVLGGLLRKQCKVFKLKTDMQGFDMQTLQNLRPILSMPDQVTHVKSECFLPVNGKRIYETVENDCYVMAAYLRSLGYTSRVREDTKWVGDVYAYKAPATDYLDERAFN